MELTGPLTRRLRNVLSSFQLHWSVDLPTRVTATTSIAIDNVITTIPDETVSILNTGIYDHYTLAVEVCGYKLH